MIPVEDSKRTNTTSARYAIMKNTFFLMNIQDECYAPIKTTCRSDPTIDFEECIQKIKSEAIAMGKLEDSRSGMHNARALKKRPTPRDNFPSTRRRATMRNAAQARGQKNKYPFLPDNIWKQMSGDEVARYKEIFAGRKG